MPSPTSFLVSLGDPGVVSKDEYTSSCRYTFHLDAVALATIRQFYVYKPSAESFIISVY